MKITIIGSGYVGLVSGICLAQTNHEVVCIDKDINKINKLRSGEVPIYEPGLDALLKESLAANKISFETDLEKNLESSQAVFIAVGTPQGEDGSADLSYVLAAAEEIAKKAKSPKLIITKSTVPAGTGFKIKNLVKKANPNINFAIASNPEFLREGCAIADFMYPDRIVIGCEDESSKKIMAEIYHKFSAKQLIFTDIITAELIKYAANSFLAMKVAFINEMANLCEKVGGNIKQLSSAIGRDSRIGEKFLNPGPGFGGSCFPKDILAILNFAQENNVDLSLIDSAMKANNLRKTQMVKKIAEFFSNQLTDKKIALLGLAFKANTDDIRYSPAIAIAQELLKKGAQIFAHDPQAIENARIELQDFKNVEFYDDMYEAAKNADLLVIATEWDEYKNMDLNKLKSYYQHRQILDLRNLFDSAQVAKHGFEYFFVGGSK